MLIDKFAIIHRWWIKTIFTFRSHKRPLVTDDGLCYRKAFYKVKIVFIHPLWMILFYSFVLCVYFFQKYNFTFTCLYWFDFQNFISENRVTPQEAEPKNDNMTTITIVVVVLVVTMAAVIIVIIIIKKKRK